MADDTREIFIILTKLKRYCNSNMRKNLGKIVVLSFVAMMFAATNAMAQSKPWAKLDNGVLTFTYGSKPSAPASVKCTNCGKILSNADKFCSNCGTKKPKQAVQVFAVPLNSQKEEDLPWDDVRENINKVVIASSFKQVTNLLSTSYWFALMKITHIDGLQNLRTDNVRNMGSMFWNCRTLTSLNLSSFNTRNVSDMSGMFCGCEALTSLNLSSFNTSKVTNMNTMFCCCKKLTSLDLSSFNTSKVTDMDSMFCFCTELTSLNLSSFNTSKVTYMRDMFMYCDVLTSITVSAMGWQTSQAIKSSFLDHCPAQIIKK